MLRAAFSGRAVLAVSAIRPIVSLNLLVAPRPIAAGVPTAVVLAAGFADVEDGAAEETERPGDDGGCDNGDVEYVHGSGFSGLSRFGFLRWVPLADFHAAACEKRIACKAD